MSAKPKNAEQPTIAFFDFDGTITDTDSFTAFMRYSAQPWRVVCFGPLLLPLYLGYKAGFVPASPLRRLVSLLALRGRHYRELQHIGQQYAARCLPKFIRPTMLAKIDWHLAQGHEVVVVSASLDLYLQPWCQQHQLALLCSEVEQQQQRLTGSYVNGDCCAQRKVSRIQQAYNLTHYQKIYAYGDTDEDLAMLALADEAYLNNKLYQSKA